jgi:hypothetical protein
LSQEFSTILQLGTAVLVGFGVWFLQDIRTQMRDMRKAMDEKVDIADCDRKTHSCIPPALFKHTHTGLPETSEVILRGAAQR